MKKTLAVLLVFSITGLLLPLFSVNAVAQANNLLDSLSIPQWVNQLNIPPIFVPQNVTDNSGKLLRQTYSIDVSQFEQQILPTTDSNGNPTGFGSTTVWGFGGQAQDPITGENSGFVKSSPGCTFEATKGVPVQVNWTNNLVDSAGNPLSHLFLVDPTLNWANPNNFAKPNPNTAASYPNGYSQAQNPVPICIHLHGAEVQSASDGNPNAWWTANGIHGPDYSTTVPTSANSAVFYYPNTQQPTTLWYHDHSMGITRLNVMSGLAGFYLLRSNDDSIANQLPKGEYEIPMVIQDRNFLSNGQFYFSTQPSNSSVHTYWNPTFQGNTIMVNGKVWPTMDVKQGIYRLRILDGSNSRFYTLHFSNNMNFTLIGSDGGYLKTPVSLNSLTIAPAERVDILVDFSKVASAEKIILQNINSGLTAEEKNTLGHIVQFTVNAKEGVTSVPLPTELNPTLKGDYPTLQATAKNRTLTLIEVGNFPATTTMLLDGQSFDAPISEKPQLGTTEDWIIVNPTMNTHPIHLHLVQFQLVSRQIIASIQYQNTWNRLNGQPPLNHTTIPVPSLDSYLVGKPIMPTANEQCWKDTIQANAGEVTIIRVRFAPQDNSNYAFNPTAGPGYVWHCHILDHEDNEMMRPYIVIQSNNGVLAYGVWIAVIAILIIVIILAIFILRRITKNRSSLKTSAP
jgi:spore coat protein A, manganese oxidase